LRRLSNIDGKNISSCLTRQSDQISEEHQKAAYKKVAAHLRTMLDTKKTIFSDIKFFNCTYINPDEPEKNIGHNELLDIISANSDFINLVNLNILNETNLRKNLIGKRIVRLFTLLTSLVSLIPVFDIAINMVLIDYMIEILSYLATDPTKTIEKFHENESWKKYSIYGVRAFGYVVGGVLDVAGVVTLGVGYAIGSGVGVTTNAIGTPLLGHFALDFFISNDKE